MKDMKLRNENTLVFGDRRSFNTWWLIPVLVLATGGIYGALQLDGDGNRSAAQPSADDALKVALALPDHPALPPPASLATPQSLDNSQNTPSTEAGAPKQSEPEVANAEEFDKKPTPPPSRWLTHEIAAGDNLARVFKDLDLSAGLLHGLVQSSKTAKQLERIKPGQRLRIELDENDGFVQLRLQTTPTRTLVIKKSDDGYAAEWLERDVEEKTKTLSGTIESSLFVSAQKAGLSDALIMELATIFGWDIDFALEIRSGDRFNVIFTEHWLDGKKIDDGPIVAAEFINQGRTYRTVRFEDEFGRGHYYTPDGKSMRKAFLRAPVDFRRISSTFRTERWHPVLGKKRPHRGVDYAAATGTPIKAAGDGKVIFRGHKGGYGKTVVLQHANKYTTLYAHMSKYSANARQGQRVKQGQTIGYVGQTGLATGPHLHYEFRVSGVHRNPLTVELPKAEPIARKYQESFAAISTELTGQLDAMGQILVAKAK